MKPIGNLVGGVAARATGSTDSARPTDLTRPAHQVSTLTPEASRAILAAPVPALLAEALAAADGPIRPYTKPDGTVGYRTPPLPGDRDGALAMAKQRREALRVALARAPEKMVRGWCALVATATETRERGDGMAALLNALVTLLDLPACCYSAESVRMVARDAARHDGWMPSYARINPIIAPLAAPMREEAARLDALIALLEAGAPGNLLAAPKPGAAEVFTDAEIDAWIASVSAAPASFLRMRQCSRYLATLAKSRPDLSDDRRAAIEALRDAPYGQDDAALAKAAARGGEDKPSALDPAVLAAAEALKQRREQAMAEAERKRRAALGLSNEAEIA